MAFGEKFDDKTKKVKDAGTISNEGGMMRKVDVGIEVVGRTKELYSLWHKMEMKQDRDLDHITNLVTLRVILTPSSNSVGRSGGVGSSSVRDDGEANKGVWLCYHVLGLVQHLPGFHQCQLK